MNKKRSKMVLTGILSLAMGMGAWYGMADSVSALEAAEDVMDHQGDSDEAGIEAVQPITTRITSEDGIVEFEISRDKETYQFGEEIKLSVKATNLGDEPLGLEAEGCNLGIEGCIRCYLADAEGERLFRGLQMEHGARVQWLYYGSEEGRQFLPGQTIEGQQIICTSPMPDMQQGEYKLVVRLHHDYYLNQGQAKKDVEVSIPIIMTGSLSEPVTSSALRFEEYGVTEIKTDDSQTVRYEVTRDRESYQLGDAVLLAMKVTNISDQILQIRFPMTGIYGAGGTICTKLQSLDNDTIFKGYHMRKEADYYIAGGAITTDSYFGELEPGESMEGWQVIKTSYYSTGQQDGDYQLVISVRCADDSSDDTSATKEKYETTFTIPMQHGDEIKPTPTPIPSEEPLPTKKEEYDMPQVDYLAGDVDRNQVIDLADAQQVLRYVLELDEGDEYQMFVADYNEDGDIDLKDVQRILRVYLELDQTKTLQHISFDEIY